MDLKVRRLDHLGIVAGVTDDLKIVDLIDERLKPDKQEEITPGEVVKGMIINGLGFANRVTTLAPQFFESKAIESMFRPGISADHFNRHKIGRVLDEIADYGCEALFNEIALTVCKEEGIEIRQLQTDTTSFSVEGSYENQEEDAEVEIRYGYSKDHRPDLKQFVLELVVTSDGGTPVMMRPWSGNASDNAIFHERVQSLKRAAQVSHTGRTLIADAKLYTKANIGALGNLSFVTRVPASIKEENHYIEAAIKDDEWQEAEKGYKYRVYHVEHYGIAQRWVVYYSEQAYQRAQVTQAKAIKKESEQITKDLYHLQAKRFSCKKDGLAALKALTKKYKYHKLASGEAAGIERYLKQGRPVEGATKKVHSYQVNAEFEIDRDAVRAELDHKSCFVLATNIPEDHLAAVDVIKEYKRQDYVEKAFAFMKAPSFFAAAFYIKNEKRIQAMLVVMVLALLVYMIAQRRLRRSLVANQQTIPNQIRKPIQNPTLRWAFQILEGIDEVAVYAVTGPIQKIMHGLTDLRKLILSSFGNSVMQIYGLAANSS